jgi:ribosomal protein L40E
VEREHGRAAEVMAGVVYIDPANLTWDGHNACWVWASPSGVRYYQSDFSMEYNRAEEPRKKRSTRKAQAHVVDKRGLWVIQPEVLVPALRATGAIVAARWDELERARRSIQVHRQAEQLEGVVTATECLHCGAPPPPRGTPCRYCSTVAPA